LSQPNPKRLASSHVLTSVSWQMSLSRKICLDSVTGGLQCASTCCKWTSQNFV